MSKIIFVSSIKIICNVIFTWSVPLDEVVDSTKILKLPIRYNIYFFMESLFVIIDSWYWIYALTPHGQLSLQGTFGGWTDTKVLWTKADDGGAGM